LEPVTVTLAADQLGLTDWLYRNGDVVARTDNEDGSVSISMKATAAAREEIENRLRRNNKG
jgi:GTP-binding protein HflX